MPTTNLSFAQFSAYSVAGVATCGLLAFFGWALPDLVHKAQEGLRKTLEAPCQVLSPSETTALGRLPQRAPDFALKTADGTEVRLSALRGRVVLLNFWATWCPPCLQEEPALESLARQLRAQPFSILAVSVDNDWQTVRAHFPNGSPLTVLLDTPKTVPAQYGTQKFPETFLIDRAGNIRYFVIGERLTWNSPQVQACIQAMIDE